MTNPSNSNLEWFGYWSFVIITGALATLCLFPSIYRNATHQMPTGSKLVQIMKALVFESGDEDTQVKAKSIKKAIPVIVMIMFYFTVGGMSESVFQNQQAYYEPLWKNMPGAFAYFFDPIGLLIAVAFIEPAMYLLKRQGICVTQQRKMFVGMIFSVLAAGTMTLLTFITVRLWEDKKEKLYLLFQLIQWVFHLASQYLIYATGVDYAYMVAHPEMKSTLLSLFYLALGSGQILSSVVYFIFDGTMKQELEGPKGHEMPVGYNGVYQGMIFTVLQILTLVLFYFTVDWEKLSPSTDDRDVESQSEADMKWESQSAQDQKPVLAA